MTTKRITYALCSAVHFAVALFAVLVFALSTASVAHSQARLIVDSATVVSSVDSARIARREAREAARREAAERKAEAAAAKAAAKAEKDSLALVERAQRIVEAEAKKALAADSLSDSAFNARLAAVNDSLFKDSRKAQLKALQRASFVPNPKRALWLALVLPGAGQIYNRKYWKLPIFYGGFLGCTYALLWNQQMYRDYSQAYLDIMDDDPATQSYMEMLPPRYDISGREEQFKSLFKRKKDYFRRYRDMSAFAFVGVYILSVIDAYVDAQLSVFDISPDLSMQIEPAVISTGSTLSPKQRSAYGIGCSLRF